MRVQSDPRGDAEKLRLGGISTCREVPRGRAAGFGGSFHDIGNSVTPPPLSPLSDPFFAGERPLGGQATFCPATPPQGQAPGAASPLSKKGAGRELPRTRGRHQERLRLSQKRGRERATPHQGQAGPHSTLHPIPLYCSFSPFIPH